MSARAAARPRPSVLPVMKIRAIALRTHSSVGSIVTIIQTRDHVVLYSELIHEARIIPLDGRPPHNAGARFAEPIADGSDSRL